jgi:hypothetical protein
MRLLGRRAFIGGLSGAALAGSVGALAQSRSGGFDLASALSQLREGACRYVPVSSDPNVRNFENIAFRHWELPNRVFVENYVIRGARTVQITRFEANGSFLSTTDRGLLRGRFNPDGSAAFEGEAAGQHYSGRMEFIGGGRTRIATRLANGLAVTMETQPVPADEALRIAARLYPAEYAPHPPAQYARHARSGLARPGGQGAAASGPGFRIGAAAAPPGRSALVIGAGNYAGLPILANPPNDARAVARGLTGLGYRVDLLIDPDRGRIVDALARLGTQRGERNSQTEIFYFAGHAIEIRGRNFLLGVDMPLSPSNIESQALPLDVVIGELSAESVSTRIIILDACRNGPARWPGMGQGLAQISAPQGTYVAYSTAPGMVAMDGAGQDSPFTLALVSELARPSQPIEAVFRSVRRSVVEATAGQQIPWDSSSLVEPFSFA